MHECEDEPPALPAPRLGMGRVDANARATFMRQTVPFPGGVSRAKGYMSTSFPSNARNVADDRQKFEFERTTKI